MVHERRAQHVDEARRRDECPAGQPALPNALCLTLSPVLMPSAATCPAGISSTAAESKPDPQRPQAARARMLRSCRRSCRPSPRTARRDRRPRPSSSATGSRPPCDSRSAAPRPPAAPRGRQAPPRRPAFVSATSTFTRMRLVARDDGQRFPPAGRWPPPAGRARMRETRRMRFMSARIERRPRKAKGAAAYGGSLALTMWRPFWPLPIDASSVCPGCRSSIPAFRTTTMWMKMSSGSSRRCTKP